jgi:YidC/Oxa1 family membrane protein insertase
MHTRYLVLLILGFASLLLLGGCGQSPQLPQSQLSTVKSDLQEIDRLDVPHLNDKKEKLKGDIADLTESSDKKDQANIDYTKFLRAYVEERLGIYGKAVDHYMEISSSSPYRSLALFRAGEVASHAPEDAKDAVADAEKKAGKAYTDAAGFYVDPKAQILVRYPALGTEELQEWKLESLRTAANSRADPYNRNTVSYKAINALVSFTGRNKAFSYGFAIILIALFVKLLTTPLTTRQFKGMREMQTKMAVVQPLITEMQKKYKGDKEAQMREQMRIYKENNVNPAGGCLPMLIMLVQMPFLIWVFYAIRAYAWQFEGTSFLWVPNLAMPDIALLVLYAVSLYFSQKLTTPPSTDPQQQQMTRMMSLLMPFMLLMFLKNASAAFILYWFAQNVLMTGHQYLMYRKNPVTAPVAVVEKKTVKR